MKRVAKTILTLVTVGALALAAGACTPSTGGSVPPETENELTLNATELTLTLGDEYSLIADYTPIEGEETVFVSSNPEVASVDEYGLIVANKAGEAIITVSYGELSKTCNVVVGYGGMLPTLCFEESIADNVQVGVGESINLSAYVVFNGKRYEDAVIEYTFSDDTIGTVVDGLFSPVKVGTTSVVITAGWRGMEGVETLTKTINLTAVNVVEVVVNGGEANFTVYNLATLGGNEYQVSMDFVVEAKENDVLIPSDRITISVYEGTEVLRYEDGKIYGLKPGTAKVLVSVTDQLGGVFEERIEVTVLTSIGDYEDQIVFSAYDGELPLADIFGSEVELVSAFCNGEELVLNANKNGVLGLTTTKEGPSSQQITVYSDTQAWNLQLLVYSGIIDEASDLDMFYLGNDRDCLSTFSAEDTFNGYYILANDIDCTGYVFGASKEPAGETPSNLTKQSSIGPTNMRNVGLTGVFEGNGYSITNFTPNGAGLFAAINGGTLKNVRISSAGAYSGGGAFLSAMMRNATLQNVYVDAGSLTMYGTNGLSKFVIDSTLENCVFKCTTAASGRTWGGLVFAIQESTFTNCYAITNRPLSADTTPVYDSANQKPTDDTSATVWVEGIKRYASDAEMAADSSNDLTLFPKRYWDVSNGLPVWRGGFEYILQDGNGKVLSDAVTMEKNQELQVEVFALGEKYTTPTLSLKSGETIIDISGTTIIALSVGEATVEVVWTAEGKEYTRTITISVINATTSVEEYSERLLFSAVDGLFFNAQGSVVSIEDIFGSGAVLLNATHATDMLTVSEGAVLGLTTNGTSAIATQIILITAEKSVKVNVDAYTLVIDEAADLDYFYLGNDRQTTDKGVWTEADVFGGYYVLAKNIDCTGYVFGASKEGEGETPKNLGNPGGIGSKDLMDIGLTGTFDGKGYSITNFTPNGTGLFAAINGGTLKNVSISGTGTYSGGGAFLSAMMRNATLQNVYVDAGALTMYGTNGLSKFVIGSTLENCVFKCTTGASGRTWGGLVFEIKESTFTNCYAITNRPLSADAATVYDSANQKPADDTSATVWVEGIKRYASVADLEAAEATNTFASFNTTYWTVETGKLPVWKGRA